MLREPLPVFLFKIVARWSVCFLFSERGNEDFPFSLFWASSKGEILMFDVSQAEDFGMRVVLACGALHREVRCFLVFTETCLETVDFCHVWQRGRQVVFPCY